MRPPGTEPATTPAEPAGEESICVAFDLTPEEWVEVSLEHSNRSSMVRDAVRNVRILFTALVVLAALISLLDGSGMAAVIWLSAGAVVQAALGPIIRNSRRKQLEQFAEKGIANGMFGPHRVELRPEGMVDSTEGYEWLTRWSAIERVEEGEGAFLIYSGSDAFLPIPHSAFRDSESLRRFSDAFYSLRDRGEPPALLPPDRDRPGDADD